MAGRTLLRWGGATDVGMARSINQDRLLARADVALWAVADGMGGHRGGEVASQVACDSLGGAFSVHTVGGLVDAIGVANTQVFETGHSDPDLAGMGTTVVALALVEEEGEEVLAVANVGDSRAYRFTGGELDQITEDHSLVAELVREGRLSPDEAAIHPQRNIVTRVLGVYGQVPVDVVTVLPRHGDRFLLCSDGLFNEVTESGIAAVLRRLGDPADAARELVRLANEGGGRDNITVVVVDVVDDGGQAEAASAALAAEPSSGHTNVAPASAPGAANEDPGLLDSAEGAEPAAAGAAEAGEPPRHRVPRARRFTWRVGLFIVLLLGLIGGAFATIQWYGRSTYFVGFDGDEVAIFRGRPGGLLWIDPELVETTSLDRDRVPNDTLRALDDGREQSSLDDARAYVSRVRDRADALDRSTRTTTTTAPTTTTRPPTATTRRPGRTTTTAAR